MCTTRADFVLPWPALARVGPCWSALAHVGQCWPRISPHRPPLARVGPRLPLVEDFALQGPIVLPVALLARFGLCWPDLDGLRLRFELGGSRSTYWQGQTPKIQYVHNQQYFSAIQRILRGEVRLKHNSECLGSGAGWQQIE